MQNLFTPSERPGSGSVEKNSAKIFTAVFSQCLLSRMGMKKITIFDQYLALSRKRYKIGSYFQRKTEDSMRSIKQCHDFKVNSK